MADVYYVGEPLRAGKTASQVRLPAGGPTATPGTWAFRG